jgi:integrase
MMTTTFPRIRRTVHGVVPPYVQLATGARTQREHDRRVVVFNELADDSQIAVIQALVDGRISWEEVIDARRRKELKGAGILASIALDRALVPAIADALPRMGKAKATRARYGVTRKQVEKSLVDDRALWFPLEDPRAEKGAAVKVKDLAGVQWEQLHNRWLEQRSAADWNHVARMLSAFLTKHLGDKHHPFAREIRALMPCAVEDERVPDLTPATFWRIFERSLEHVRPVWMCLLLLGCRVRQEYLKIDRDRQLMPDRHAVKFPGTGSSKSKRGRVVTVDEEYWPWIDAGVPAPLAYKALHRQWQRACVAAGAGTWADPDREVGYVCLRMLDLRDALGQWASDAGVPLDRISDVLGHTNVATTARYTRVSSSNQVARAAGDALRRSR